MCKKNRPNSSSQESGQKHQTQKYYRPHFNKTKSKLLPRYDRKFDRKILQKFAGQFGGSLVGDVEVYKVNHHGSRFSSTDAWLDAISPEVAIISVGDNSFGHPTANALGRLHDHDVQTYWTNIGDGVSPDLEFDTVGGTVVVEALPVTYSVSGEGFLDSYQSE